MRSPSRSNSVRYVLLGNTLFLVCVTQVTGEEHKQRTKSFHVFKNFNYAVNVFFMVSVETRLSPGIF